MEAIGSIDALSAYFTETPGEEILYRPFTIDQDSDPDDASVYILVVLPASLFLSDSKEYQNLTPVGQVTEDARSALAKKMLMKLGYSEAEALVKIENCLAFEKELAPCIIPETEKYSIEYVQKINNHYTRRKLLEAEGNVPVIETIENACGYPQMDSYLVTEPEWLAKLNSLYTEENLQKIKDHIMIHTILNTSALLDRECFDWFMECDNTINGVTGTVPDDVLISQAVTSLLEWPVARLYCETYLEQEDKDRISELIDEIKDEYHGVITEADFLSDETKKAAIEKLEAINKSVLWPDDWSAYECSDLDFSSAEEGGSLWDAYTAILKYRGEKKRKEYSEPADKSRWIISPAVMNAGYDASNNNILILGAFARGDIYNSKMSDEDLYARIGMIIGHEISHAFDAQGAQYDKDGNLASWWTEEDFAAFEKKVARTTEYFAKIHPWQGQDYYPENKSGEACADMAGLKCILRLAAKNDGFDYDRFFRSYADLWCSKGTLNATHRYLQNEHPLPYLRVNCPLQQFDEFLDFYGIKEGDGMYLAPEDRVRIW